MSTLNRVWDGNAGPGFVQWKTQVPDTTGAEYPGPGTFGVDTSDYTVVRDTRKQAPAEPQLLGMEYNPVGLWQLNGSLVDDSPTGANLSVGTGTEQYGPGLIPGTQAAYFDRATRLETVAPAPAALRILGDATWELLVKPDDVTVDSFGDSLVHCAGTDNSAVEADNFLWMIRLALDNTAGRLTHPFIYWENGGGGPNILEDTGFVVPKNQWTHLAGVRINGGAGATIGRIYVNGVKTLESTTLNEPTGGTNARVKIGGSTTGVSDFLGHIQSVKVIDRALTDDEVWAEARRTGVVK